MDNDLPEVAASPQSIYPSSCIHLSGSDSVHLQPTTRCLSPMLYYSVYHPTSCKQLIHGYPGRTGRGNGQHWGNRSPQLERYYERPFCDRWSLWLAHGMCMQVCCWSHCSMQRAAAATKGYTSAQLRVKHGRSARQLRTATRASQKDSDVVDLLRVCTIIF